MSVPASRRTQTSLRSCAVGGLDGLATTAVWLAACGSIRFGVRTCARIPKARKTQSLFQNCLGSCGEGLWLRPRRRGPSIPATGCNDRANAGSRRKTRRPSGCLGRGCRASCSLANRPVVPGGEAAWKPRPVGGNAVSPRLKPRRLLRPEIDRTGGP